MSEESIVSRVSSVGLATLRRRADAQQRVAFAEIIDRCSRSCKVLQTNAHKSELAFNDKPLKK